MKKGMLILLAIFLIAQVTALSGDIKTSYSPSETIIAKLSGSVLEPITKDQIEFKRANVRVPLEYDIKKIGDNYYFWAIAPENANNYTIYIYNVATSVSGVPQKVNYTANFTVSGDKIDYSVNPGVIFSKGDFEVNVLLNRDEPESISVDYPEQRTILLQPGNNKIKFDTSKTSGSVFILIHVGKYALPSNIIGNFSDGLVYNDSNVSNRPVRIEFKPSKIDRIIFAGQERANYPIEIINYENYTLKDVRLDYNQDIFVIKQNKFNINANSSISLNITLNSTNQTVRESIFAKYNNTIIELPIIIKFSEENLSTILNITNTTVTQGYYCEELGGKVCKASEVCSGNIASSLNGQCCIGLCKAGAKKSSSSWIGYLIGALGIIVLVYLYMRYKKGGKISKKQVFADRVEDASKNLP